MCVCVCVVFSWPFGVCFPGSLGSLFPFVSLGPLRFGFLPLFFCAFCFGFGLFWVPLVPWLPFGFLVPLLCGSSGFFFCSSVHIHTTAQIHNCIFQHQLSMPGCVQCDVHLTHRERSRMLGKFNIPNIGLQKKAP